MLREAGELALNLYHQAGSGPCVLYVHGATFPSALSVAYRLNGESWADNLQSRGFDVWSFDFPGYGGSDRPAAMGKVSSRPNEVPGRANDAAHQIERVVRHIRSQTACTRTSIIAHSWGTIPAARFAGDHPEWVDRLVLFGPVAQRDRTARDIAPTAASRSVSTADQWRSFQTGVPGGEASPISKSDFEVWAKAYLGTDPTSGERSPPTVRVPAGPDVDFDEAWNGHLPFDPSIVRASTLIVRGEWDAITRDADAAWLVHAMVNVPGGAQDLKLARGAHRMHLEANRQELFDAVGEFLAQVRP